MDGRFDTRYPADLEVWVTDLQNQGYSACGTLHDISESGVSVITPLRLGPGDVVRLDVGDSVLFGFATYCNQNPTSARVVPVVLPIGVPVVDTNPAIAWRAGIEIQRVLVGGSDLSQLLRQVLGEQLPNLRYETLTATAVPPSKRDAGQSAKRL